MNEWSEGGRGIEVGVQRSVLVGRWCSKLLLLPLYRSGPGRRGENWLVGRSVGGGRGLVDWIAECRIASKTSRRHRRLADVGCYPIFVGAPLPRWQRMLPRWQRIARADGAPGRHRRGDLVTLMAEINTLPIHPSAGPPARPSRICPCHINVTATTTVSSSGRRWRWQDGLGRAER